MSRATGQPSANCEYYQVDTPILHPYYTNITPILHQYYTNITPILHEYYQVDTPRFGLAQALKTLRKVGGANGRIFGGEGPPQM